MRKLYFVRHGLSEMNKLGVFSGRTETPLAPEGYEQARLAGQLLKDAGIDIIVSSPLKRARDTAHLIADAIGHPKEHVIMNELFVERDFGSLEGKPYIPGLIASIRVKDAETTRALLKRTREGLDYLHTLPGDTILVVSHGAVGRALRHHLHPRIPYHGSKRFDNAEVVRLL